MRHTDDALPEPGLGTPAANRQRVAWSPISATAPGVLGASGHWYDRVLGRPMLRLASEPMRAALRGRSVLLTGAGGSIGSAVAHVILRSTDCKLVLLDSSERAVERLARLVRMHGVTDRVSLVLGDFLDPSLVEQVLEAHRPDVVLHAAALKRLSLLEAQPLAALRTNFLGTRQLLRAVQRRPEVRFVLVSTDKAVLPTSVLGVSKRLGELSVLGSTGWRAKQSCCVRLCNVLGSSGSVAPRLHRQALAGGPLTVSDLSVTRYMITRGEAAHIVLAALSHCQGADILVPQPGEPISLMRLVEFALASVGRTLRAGDVQTTGLRCGEKARELLTSPSECVVPVPASGIARVVGPLPEVRTTQRVLARLEAAVLKGDPADVVTSLREALPGYRPSLTARRALGMTLTAPP